MLFQGLGMLRSGFKLSLTLQWIAIKYIINN